MEDRAPYPLAAPQGPRNLAPPLAAWLRTQGFSAYERAQPHFVALEAHWISPRFERFEFTYTWQAGPCPDATCQLRVLSHQLTLHVEVLFTAQRVRRLRDARLLVSNCVRLSNARLLAAPTPLVPS